MLVRFVFVERIFEESLRINEVEVAGFVVPPSVMVGRGGWLQGGLVGWLVGCCWWDVG